MNNTIIVTGGAGFIGSAVVRFLINETKFTVINVDKLTYAGNLKSLDSVCDDERYIFEQIDICNRVALEQIFFKYKPCGVMHLAAESHVDRSIDDPSIFIKTNIEGTFHLLEATRQYWSTLDPEAKKQFKFHHISTDEVYGDLEGTDALFTEKTPYSPSSPYSASKAASDHLVRAWGRTYGLPIVLTNCSNNYGPYHFPEKLIPVIILNCLSGKPLPIYGKGTQIRDWLYVEDHARALYAVFMKGRVGETYNIGGHNERRNIDVVKDICNVLDELYPAENNANAQNITHYSELITHVADRAGHDLRYAIDASKIFNELGWKPKESFESGIRKTVQWFLENQSWWQEILDGKHQLGRMGILANSVNSKK